MSLAALTSVRQQGSATARYVSTEGAPQRLGVLFAFPVRQEQHAKFYTAGVIFAFEHLHGFLVLTGSSHEKDHFFDIGDGEICVLPWTSSTCETEEVISNCMHQGQIWMTRAGLVVWFSRTLYSTLRGRQTHVRRTDAFKWIIHFDMCPFCFLCGDTGWMFPP